VVTSVVVGTEGCLGNLVVMGICWGHQGDMLCKATTLEWLC